MLVGLDPQRELKEGSDPHFGATDGVTGETFKAERETADLWQPKWNETQTVLATAIHTLESDSPCHRARTRDRDTGPLEGAAAGS